MIGFTQIPENLKQIKKFKNLWSLVFILGLLFILSGETKAQRIAVNDGYIEYIKYSPDAIEIMMTTPKGTNFASAFMNARELARRVQAHRPYAYRAWPPINITKLAAQIQAHAVAYSVHFKRNHANPVNVYWREVT